MPNWPSESDLKILVQKSSGQFIYASTVIKYITNDRCDPCDSLNTIIDLKMGDTAPYVQLDALYTHIISMAAEKAGSYYNIQLIFQAHMWLFDGRCNRIHNMALFLGMSKSHLLLHLADLHSLVFVPKSDEEDIHFFHASFSDFLKDSDRSKCFHISEKDANIVLGSRCVDIIVNNEIPIHKVDEKNHILWYAYTYLIDHLKESDYDQNLTQKLLLKCESNIEAIVKILLMQNFETSTSFYNAFCVFYKFDESAYVFFDSAIPLSENVCKIFGQIPFTVAVEYCLNISSSNDDKNILYEYIETVFNFHENHRISTKKVSDYKYEKDITCILLQEILESPLRAGNYFLNDMKSEQIFRGAWDCITGYNRALWRLSAESSPMGFKYLLERIKPSLYFKTFLQEFAQNFEYCFSNLKGYRAFITEDKCDVFKDNLRSLMITINNFLKCMLGL
ncbi:hypothetical protein BDQ17DRAFT_1499330 [Cyathus striatus]|nr:hypothetical protein BDQ17DRAFT_1499330 [Cyathus striatus]